MFMGRVAELVYAPWEGTTQGIDALGDPKSREAGLR